MIRDTLLVLTLLAVLGCSFLWIYSHKAKIFVDAVPTERVWAGIDIMEGYGATFLCRYTHSDLTPFETVLPNLREEAAIDDAIGLPRGDLEFFYDSPWSWNCGVLCCKVLNSGFMTLSLAGFQMWFPVFVLLLFALFLARPRIRRRIRRYKGLCIHCSYNLKGNESGICPECGAAVALAPVGRRGEAC